MCFPSFGQVKYKASGSHNRTKKDANKVYRAVSLQHGLTSGYIQRSNSPLFISLWKHASIKVVN